MSLNIFHFYRILTRCYIQLIEWYKDVHSKSISGCAFKVIKDVQKYNNSLFLIKNNSTSKVPYWNASFRGRAVKNRICNGKM